MVEQNFLPSYEFVCLHCGEPTRDERRFFDLAPLLEMFVLTIDGQKQSVCSVLQKYLKFGCFFGGKVLGVDVPTIGTENMHPAQEELKELQLTMSGVLQMLNEQLCLPENALTNAVNLLRTINTGAENLQTLYESLSEEAGSDEEAQFVTDYPVLEENLLPLLNVGSTLNNEQTRMNRLNEFFKALVDLTVADEEYHTVKRVGAVWIFRGRNGRKYYDRLYLREWGIDRAVTVCESCCCPWCHAPISKQFGVYQQKIVGVLGGQSTGKTTFLAAFSDFVDREITRYGELPFTLKSQTEGDALWKSFCQSAAETANYGAKWAYQNGYEAQKTDLRAESACSLTFLITPNEQETNGEKEPLLYVLGDISGETFNGKKGLVTGEALNNTKRLLCYCTGIFMVMSCDPEQAGTTASEYDEWLDKFLPEKPIPVAFLLTKFDYLQQTLPKGLVPPALQLPYMLDGKIQPVHRGYGWNVKTGELTHSSYFNLEQIAQTCRYATGWANKIADGLYAMVRQKIRQKCTNGAEDRMVLAMFPVCNGTQDYASCDTVSKIYKLPGVGETNADDSTIKIAEDVLAAARQRYAGACAKRFGLLAPFLWLLAMDGLLPVGLADGCDRELEQTVPSACMQKCILDRLYCPGE